ncbi:rhomboid domain-containing protein 3 [Paramormyrops kingsleyae]|uniref:Rhomboid domain containing 3 n=1 Tax=Paramormyrops kingsleyae TaxID=1676925 RepID=A0A3B3QLZ9_9TELE|nr:rhomboid domain-containing protein 3 [Paramormyrops kingsleyae]
MMLKPWEFVSSIFGSRRPGFPLGTAVLLAFILSAWFGGIRSSLSIAPGTSFPGLQVYRLLLYAFSHEELPSLLYSAALLVSLGRIQEQRWGTVAFLGLSILSASLPALLYASLMWVAGTQSSRICGYSAAHMAMFTAQCRCMKQRRLPRWVSAWLLPLMLLLINLALLPSSPLLFHVCAIFIGFFYSPALIRWLQKGEALACWGFLPTWAFVTAFSRDWLPTHSTEQRSVPLPESYQPTGQADQWVGLPSIPSVPDWLGEMVATPALEAQLLDEEMLRVGILASLQDTPERLGDKVEVPKSSVSSLRLQQLERMGFPTEKAVVALAATGQLDGAISLLINDSVGEEAVVTSQGRWPTSPWSS